MCWLGIDLDPWANGVRRTLLSMAHSFWVFRNFSSISIRDRVLDPPVEYFVCQCDSIEVGKSECDAICAKQTTKFFTPPNWASNEAHCGFSKDGNQFNAHKLHCATTIPTPQLQYTTITVQFSILKIRKGLKHSISDNSFIWSALHSRKRNFITIPNDVVKIFGFDTQWMAVADVANVFHCTSAILNTITWLWVICTFRAHISTPDTFSSQQWCIVSVNMV